MTKHYPVEQREASQPATVSTHEVGIKTPDDSTRHSQATRPTCEYTKSTPLVAVVRAANHC